MYAVNEYKEGYRDDFKIGHFWWFTPQPFLEIPSLSWDLRFECIYVLTFRLAKSGYLLGKTHFS